jgi:hypothetical protein
MRSVFSLYYHILESDSPDQYGEDIRRLERIGAAMTLAAQTRYEYVPLANAIASLNNIAKHVQQTRSHTPSRKWADFWPPDAPSAQDERLMKAGAPAQFPTEQLYDTLNPSLEMQPIDPAQWHGDDANTQVFSADLQQAVAQPGFQPLEYMQTLEDRFTSGSWNYSWWDLPGNSSSW